MREKERREEGGESNGTSADRFRNGSVKGEEEDYIETLDVKLRQAMSANSFGFLISTLAKVTREQYLNDWRERSAHCNHRGLSPWIVTTEDHWDMKVLDYLIWLGEMFNISATTMRRKMSAIRYIRLATGLADFSRVGIRYKMLVKAYAAKRPTNRKLPYNVDLLSWTSQQLSENSATEVNTEIWAALVLSFFFCMRTSELRNLRHRDIISGEKRG